MSALMRSLVLALFLLVGLCARAHTGPLHEWDIRPHPPRKTFDDSLVTYLQSPDPDLRLAALEAAGKGGVMRDSLVPLVAAALKDRDGTLRLAALWPLSRLETPATMAALCEALRDDWEVVRARAAALLGQMGPRARPALAALTSVIAELPRTRDPYGCDDRREMIRALESIGDRSALPAIRMNLSADDVNLRRAAARAIRSLDPDAHVPSEDSLRMPIVPHRPFSAFGADSVPPRTHIRPADIHVLLHRTNCYGTCPDYTVELTGDGHACYTGRKYAPRRGKFHGRVAPARVLDILDYAEGIGFFALNDRYWEPVTDLPTTFIEIRLGDRSKRIEDYVGAPVVLGRLENLIVAVEGEIRWEDGEPVPKDGAH